MFKLFHLNTNVLVLYLLLKMSPGPASILLWNIKTIFYISGVEDVVQKYFISLFKLSREPPLNKLDKSNNNQQLEHFQYATKI